MEQRLDATYLRPALFERAAAVGISVVALGMGILLGAWGISLVWRYTPPEIAVRIANPEIKLAPPPPLKGEFIVKPPPTLTEGVGGDARTPTGDVIRREVTVFSNVKHGPGTIV